MSTHDSTQVLRGPIMIFIATNATLLYSVGTYQQLYHREFNLMLSGTLNFRCCCRGPSRMDSVKQKVSLCPVEMCCQHTTAPAPNTMFSTFS